MTDYVGQPLGAPFDPAVTALLAAAERGRLVACAGAGLSMARAAALPSGRQLGERLDARARAEWAGYASPADPGDLIGSADAALAAAGSLEPLQHLVLRLADFLHAAPNLGHRATALLIAEGALHTVLLWNWDDCIERAALVGEPISVLRSLEDLAGVSRPSVAKVHGCATRPATLLITSGQLDAPPVWTDAVFARRLRDATVMFIGVGDVADYAERRLRQFAVDRDDVDVYLVSPSIERDWACTVWSKIYPALDATHRLAYTADSFLDQLLRAWAHLLVESFDRLSSTGTMVGIGTVRTELLSKDAETVVAWSREVAFRTEIGFSSIRAGETSEALLALAVVVSEAREPIGLLRGGTCRIGSMALSVLVLPRPESSSTVQAEARRRAEVLAARGADGPFRFLVSGGVVGPLGTDDPDLIASSAPDDLIHGPSTASVRYLLASDLLARFS